MRWRSGAATRLSPGMTVLATSREGLGLAGEIVWRVPSLALPDGGEHLPSPEALAQVGGGASLFVTSARWAVQPHFAVTAQNAAVVTQVCRRLDGIPLALELAAARLRGLSIEQLAARLDHSVSGCSPAAAAGASAPPDAASDGGLEPWPADADEQTPFHRLAVFAGGFTLEAAQQVAADDEIKPASMLELLTRLADKSLVRVEHARGDSRYHLLATIRDYARDRLAKAAKSTGCGGLTWVTSPSWPKRPRPASRAARRPRAWSPSWTRIRPGACPRSAARRSNSRRNRRIRWRPCGSRARWTGTPTCAAAITRPGSGWTRR